MNTVTTQVAEQVSTAIATHYNADSYLPKVFDGSHEGLRDEAKVIVWEGGDGPYDWPFYWSQTEQAQALAKELGLFFEAVTGLALGIYPKH